MKQGFRCGMGYHPWELLFSQRFTRYYECPRCKARYVEGRAAKKWDGRRFVEGAQNPVHADWAIPVVARTGLGVVVVVLAPIIWLITQALR